MKKFLLFAGLLLATVFLISLYQMRATNKQTSSPKVNLNIGKQDSNSSSEKVRVIARNLEIPWSIAFLPASTPASQRGEQDGPNGEILFTERSGALKLISNGKISTVENISDVFPIGEGGLMGLALHPDFTTNHFLYVQHTFRGNGNNTLNRVVRYKYENGKLSNRKIIVDNIPGGVNHNGGRIKFGPDGFLYITTGDALDPSRAQNKNSLAGKILRVTNEGKTPPDNPFNNLVYSYGHRNPQGITWDNQRRLWATEHGRSGVLSGLDELNQIQSGKNYGWPDIQGDETRIGMVRPIINSGANDTWAPAGATFYNGSIFFGGLRGSALYEYVISNGQLKTHFKNEFGRIREVILGPDNMLYITTSNRDGRGEVRENDDKIIRIDPRQL